MKDSPKVEEARRAVTTAEHCRHSERDPDSLGPCGDCEEERIDNLIAAVRAEQRLLEQAYIEMSAFLHKAISECPIDHAEYIGSPVWEAVAGLLIKAQAEQPQREQRGKKWACDACRDTGMIDDKTPCGHGQRGHVARCVCCSGGEFSSTDEPECGRCYDSIYLHPRVDPRCLPGLQHDALVAARARVEALDRLALDMVHTEASDDMSLTVYRRDEARTALAELEKST